MAVVVYQCDTCKRELHRKQNKLGLDVVGQCVITNGCRGKLFLQTVKPSYAIGHSTKPVIGLADWTPRKVLHTHTQGFLKKTWEVQHNLNNQPSVSAYIYKDDGKLHRVDPARVTYTSNDTLTVTFPTTTTGIVQCQARSASDGQNITTIKPVELEPIDRNTFSTSRSMPLTNGLDVGELTIATRVSTVAISGFAPTQIVKLHIHFLSPTDLSELTTIPVELTFRAVDNVPIDTGASPWANATYASIKGHKYLLRSANIHVGGSIGQTLTDRGVPQGAPCYFTVGHAATQSIATSNGTSVTAIHVTDAQFVRQGTALSTVSEVVMSGSTSTTVYTDVVAPADGWVETVQTAVGATINSSTSLFTFRLARNQAPGEILILGANAPYQSVDRDYDHVVDMYDITAANASAMTAYFGLDIVGNTALRKDIFPSIVVL